MRVQTEAAVRAADVALFLIDAREGLTALDEEIGRWLRAESTPVIVAANKAEGRGGEAGRLEAYKLGLGDPLALSAEHGEGLVDLFEALRPHVEHEGEEAEPEEEDEEGGPLKLAIVGRPNAGKSTLVNTMLGEERMITGPEAGITRDSISLDWEWQGKPVRLVDTAGLRKRARVDDKLEKLSAFDTRRAIDHAEVVVLLLDATRGLEVQDLKIADAVLEEGRGLIIALNKWDVAENASSLFQGVKRRARGRAVAAERRHLADAVGRDRQGHRPVARRRVRGSRRLVAAGHHRRTQPLVRARGRNQPAARARRQKDQVALHHPGQIAPAELRHLRQPGRPTARILSPLSDEFDAPRPQDRRGAAAADPARAKESVRCGAAINLNFTFWPIRLSVWDRARSRAPRSRTLSDDGSNIVDWVHFERSRAELGSGFIRILSYFREDGVKSVAQIETAMREQNTTALVLPAHTLKGEARQFGAEPLAEIAELIETHRALLHRNPQLPRRIDQGRGRIAQAVQPDDRIVRQGDQSAAEPRAGARRLRQARRQQPEFRTDLSFRGHARASASAELPTARGCATAHSSGPYWKRSSHGFDQASMISQTIGATKID